MANQRSGAGAEVCEACRKLVRARPEFPITEPAFTVLDGDALLDVIKNAQSESEIEAYLKPFVGKKSAAEIAAFNTEFLSHEPEPGSDGEKYFLGLRNDVAPSRTDVTKWADLLDLDEKREVPQRVGV